MHVITITRARAIAKQTTGTMSLVLDAIDSETGQKIRIRPMMLEDAEGNISGFNVFKNRDLIANMLERTSPSRSDCDYSFDELTDALTGRTFQVVAEEGADGLILHEIIGASLLRMPPQSQE